MLKIKLTVLYIKQDIYSHCHICSQPMSTLKPKVVIFLFPENTVPGNFSYACYESAWLVRKCESNKILSFITFGGILCDRLISSFINCK